MTEPNLDAGAQGNTETPDTGEGVGNGGSEFLATLPEGVRDNEAFQGMENIEALTQGYLDLSGRVRELPQLPADADGYEALPPEGVKLDEGRVNAFKAEAHKLGLTQEQFLGLVNYDVQRANEATEAMKKQRQEALDAAKVTLKDDWGDKYEEKATIADNAVSKLTSPAFRELLIKSGLNDNPIVIHTFHNLGTVLSEDQFVSAERKATGGRPTDETGKSMLDFPSMRET